MAPFPYGELLNDCAGRLSREETVLVHEMPPTVHWDERTGANPLVTRANALAQAKFHDRRGRFVYRGDNHEFRVRPTPGPISPGGGLELSHVGRLLRTTPKTLRQRATPARWKRAALRLRPARAPAPIPGVRDSE